MTACCKYGGNGGVHTASCPEVAGEVVDQINPKRARRMALVANGKCRDCAKPRGDSPYAERCAPCATKHTLAMREKRDCQPWEEGSPGHPPLIKPEPKYKGSKKSKKGKH